MAEKKISKEMEAAFYLGCVAGMNMIADSIRVALETQVFTPAQGTVLRRLLQDTSSQARACNDDDMHDVISKTVGDELARRASVRKDAHLARAAAAFRASQRKETERH